MDDAKMNRDDKENAMAFEDMDENDPYYMDFQQFSMMGSDHYFSDQSVQEQNGSSPPKGFGSELYDGNRDAEEVTSQLQDNSRTVEGNLQGENICQQADGVINQKPTAQLEEPKLPFEDEEHKMVLREQANNAAALQMKIRLETEKVIMLDRKIVNTEECVKRDLVKTDKLINDLKMENEEMRKFLKERMDMAEIMRQREQLQAIEMKDNAKYFEIIKEGVADCSKKCSVLESKKKEWQKQVDKQDLFRKKKEQLTQLIDSHKKELIKINERYVESNVHFTDRRTDLQNKLDNLSSKLSDCRAERNRRENLNANKKANLEEQKRKLSDNTQTTASNITKMKQLENDTEKLAKQRLHQKKVFQGKLSDLAEASKSSKERMDNLTNQNIAIKEQTDAAENDIKEMETRLQSLKEKYSDLKLKHEQSVVSEKDTTRKGEQQKDELHKQISSLDTKQIELQASLANIHDEKENLNTVLQELTDKNNELAAMQDEISKSEVEQRRSVNLLKDQLADLQNKCQSFDNESLRALLLTEADRVKRSQEKLYKQFLGNNSQLTEARNKLKLKMDVCDKDIKACIANKDAHLQGMEDSVVKTKRQNECELEKLQSQLDALKSKERQLRTQFEDLDRTVEEEEQQRELLERQKSRIEKLNLISQATFATRENMPKPLPIPSTSTVHQNQP